MNTEELIKKTIEIARTQNSLHNYGTEFLDRTIYYGRIKTDTNGKLILGPSGEPIVEAKAYLTIGRWISPKLMEKALKVEKQFQELNDIYRADMEGQGIEWKMKRKDIKSLEILSYPLQNENEEKIFDRRKKK